MQRQRAPFHRHSPHQRWTIDFTRVAADGSNDPTKSHIEVRLEESPGGQYGVVGTRNLRLINGTEVILHEAGLRTLGHELIAYADALKEQALTV